MGSVSYQWLAADRVKVTPDKATPEGSITIQDIKIPKTLKKLKNIEDTMLHPSWRHPVDSSCGYRSVISHLQRSLKVFRKCGSSLLRDPYDTFARRCAYFSVLT